MLANFFKQNKHVVDFVSPVKTNIFSYADCNNMPLTLFLVYLNILTQSIAITIFFLNKYVSAFFKYMG